MYVKMRIETAITYPLKTGDFIKMEKSWKKGSC